MDNGAQSNLGQEVLSPRGQRRRNPPNSWSDESSQIIHAEDHYDNALGYSHTQDHYDNDYVFNGWSDDDRDSSSRDSSEEASENRRAGRRRGTPPGRPKWLRTPTRNITNQSNDTTLGLINKVIPADTGWEVTVAPKSTPTWLRPQIKAEPDDLRVRLPQVDPRAPPTQQLTHREPFCSPNAAQHEPLMSPRAPLTARPSSLALLLQRTHPAPPEPAPLRMNSLQIKSPVSILTPAPPSVPKSCARSPRARTRRPAKEPQPPTPDPLPEPPLAVGLCGPC